MSEDNSSFDAVVIGGGFYGCAIAIYLAKQRRLGRVILVERESQLLSRASYTNQARIHNGYHYPRSFTTAFRSRVNFPRFIRDWPLAVKNDFTKLYAIARRNSKVASRQFERFCHEIGAEIAPASEEHRKLFNPNLIESAFKVQEYAFDTTQLARWAHEELSENKVQVVIGTIVESVVSLGEHELSVGLRVEGYEDLRHVSCSYIFNCTYSGLNQLKGSFSGINTALKHEVAEMALVDVPPELENLGITVMDGPFFSLMPFPAKNQHLLSHVRYTPHFDWVDERGKDPYAELESYEKVTRVDRMIRDISRYLPSMNKANYKESLFEVKTILQKNEADDGRPILFEKSSSAPGLYSILGGKIDNIYDIFEKLDAEKF